MIRAPGLSSGLRKQNGAFGWICVIWFISTLDITAGNDIELQTKPKESAKCGDNVTLTCDIITTETLEIMEFFWMEKDNNICSFDKIQSVNQTQFLCDYRVEDSRQSFNLTIMNIMPNNKGTYHCKIRSKKGAANGKTIVRLEDCIKDSQWSVRESDVECTFSGVYPQGVVKWSLGDTNFTDVTTTQTEEADGRFTVKSKVKKQKRNTTELYVCSLWLPFNDTVTPHMVRELAFAGGGEVKLQWICLLVEVVLLIFAVQL